MNCIFPNLAGSPVGVTHNLPPLSSIGELTVANDGSGPLAEAELL
ncbi:hypothetical protein [Sporosarcina sp. 6E9]|nr:hypothetical protein [Sporosarcina sp. 6E9]